MKFEALAAALPPIIPATELPRLLGGLYTAKTLANKRWAGNGPKAFKLGRKVVHMREDIISWLQEEMRPFDPDATE
ncbi:hypothetical protein LJC26_07710 [Desulfovibrio sp. OttesenSCG-928-O18]|nr:hypothetical protein [Desulfovibrio sp. OttesenSCG-928-O18]